MPLYKISVTTLEKFRRFMADTSSFDNEEALLETLEGKFEGNDKTRTGSAYHQLIENPSCGEPVRYKDTMYMLSTLEEKGQVVKIAFPLAAAEKAFSFNRAHPHMVYEIPVKKEYQLKKYRVLVSGRLDGVEGIQVHDSKTKYRSVDVMEYMQSIQWEFYLDIIGLKVFHFDLFEFKRFKELVPQPDGICYLENVEVVQHEPITCYAYQTMGEHLNYILEEFMQYIEFRNLFHLLKTVEHGEAVAS